MVTQLRQHKSLILGATGRIGQALRRFAPAKDRAGLHLQRRCPMEPSGAAGAPWHVFAPVEEARAFAAAAQGCDQILCLAGGVPGRGDLEDNSRLAVAAVEAAAEAGVGRVLLTSSAAVYGLAPGPLREDRRLTPANPYGVAKAAMEAAAAARGAALGVQVSALRIGNVAGFDAALGGWKPGFILDQFPDGTTPRRSYIGVQVLADVLCDLLTIPDLPPALNLAQPGPVEMGALLTAASLDFATRPAPQSAIAEVTLDLTLLQSCVSGPLASASGNSLVAQWRSFCQEEHHHKNEG